MKTIETMGGKTYLLKEWLIPDQKFFWNAYAPSIAEGRDGRIFCMLRSGNYRTLDDGTIKILDGDRIRSEVWLSELDTNTFELVNLRQLDWRWVTGDQAQVRYELIGGVRDAVIYMDNLGFWHFAGSVQEDYIPRRRVAEFGLVPDQSRVTEMHVMPSLDIRSENEEHYMPVHRCVANFTYLTSTTSTYHHKVHRLVKPSIETPNLTGGTQLIVAHGGLIGVMRSKIDDQGTYNHYVVKVDEDGQIYKISEPFQFLGKRNEHALGIVQTTDKFLISFGVDDSQAHLAVLDADVFSNLIDG